MQRAECPICGRILWKIPRYAPHKNEVVICQNEYYFHVQRYGHHYLAHTEKAKVEEGDEAVQEIQLILN